MNYKHGHVINKKRSPELSCWSDMMKRCYNENHVYFKRYGGRGISVCEEWHDFKVFLKDMCPRPTGLSIDRIDNDKNYSKENCKWSDAKIQSRNRSTTRWVTLGKEKKSLAEWCEIKKINYAKVVARLNKLNWPIEKALETNNKQGE